MNPEFGKAIAGVCWLFALVAFGNWAIDGMGPQEEREALWAFVILATTGIAFWLFSKEESMPQLPWIPTFVGIFVGILLLREHSIHKENGGTELLVVVGVLVICSVAFNFLRVNFHRSYLRDQARAKEKGYVDLPGYRD